MSGITTDIFTPLRNSPYENVLVGIDTYSILRIRSFYFFNIWGFKVENFSFNSSYFLCGREKPVTDNEFTIELLPHEEYLELTSSNLQIALPKTELVTSKERETGIIITKITNTRQVLDALFDSDIPSIFFFMYITFFISSIPDNSYINYNHFCEVAQSCNQTMIYQFLNSLIPAIKKESNRHCHDSKTQVVTYHLNVK